jgi:hypothetical protein
MTIKKDMEMKIQVGEYDKDGGLADHWIDGFEISVDVDNGEVVIFANQAGLKSLATHLLALSQDEVPSGYHLHFSQDYGLKEGSADLVLGKT